MKTLITGGAGFIGSNLAAHLVRAGHEVSIYDNLSRRGSESNLDWLRTKFGSAFRFIKGDVRDARLLRQAAAQQDVIYHLAAQVAVTSSVLDPREDFEVNALGTFNALEAARAATSEPIFFFASTNKVYGGLEDVSVFESSTRYELVDLPFGVPETQPLDFHSPYGCSKGVGDQYTRDYHRIYGLRTIVFRQSCIYGWRQFGVEDQGWLAHFAIAAARGQGVTIYGNGKQVRDVLFVDDLIRAMKLAVENTPVTAGQIYNIGGGPSNTLSVWSESWAILEELSGHSIPTQQGASRPGDQRIYVSDVRKAQRDFGWTPQIAPRLGLEKVWGWINANLELFD